MTVRVGAIQARNRTFSYKVETAAEALEKVRGNLGELVGLAERAAQIIDHHIERCADIIRIIGKSSKNIREIMEAHFEPSQLEGIGANMAKNEIESHLELLLECGDIAFEENRYSAAGSEHFKFHIQNLTPFG